MVIAKKPGTLARLMDRGLAQQWKLPKDRSDVRVEKGHVVVTRDGARLITDHYLPVEERNRGTILVRTPYGRGMPIGSEARLFASLGYHVVVQSTRGTFGSSGELSPMVTATDTDDAADTVAWLRERPWFDGRLATYGTSYVGATQWAMLVEPPPELRASIIISAPHNASRFILRDGALLLNDIFTWSRISLHQEKRTGLLRGMWIFARAAKLNAPVVAAVPLLPAAEKVLGGGAPWFRDALAHPDVTDPFWADRDASASLEKTTTPVCLVCGWQDLMLPQVLRQYAALHERGVEVSLTLGPWTHQEIARGVAGALAEDNLAWLAEHLAGDPPPLKRAPVKIHVTGAGEWREYPEWPPPGKELVTHLQPGGRLDERHTTPGESSFTYDPADPTPSRGGPLIDNSAGVVDNRDLEARPDVLAFTGPPLTEALEVIGVPVVELDHSRSNPHADLYVRLCDVDAEGRSHNFSEGFLRLDPAETDTVVRLRLDGCAHRLAPGHRLRLLVAGGAHPRYMRNEGTGALPGVSAELRPCRHTLHHAGRSRLLLPVSPA
ncbi:CocE/NonD family hydrolase [Actinocorallia sp. A-T 12471]|uniref:CocE/NonD family hydrolase n=1 Tax=Actinocorallia sp. A-T 12471 TaxID=3089813 RepID=UPI0029D197C0|nr:CocE/NonD family hydrolase [Actinocorallia sp. A-T 12471]MDX6740634.1 CocE/NonD family hydrolase [Actinocorallia sp. A-T 12471]